MKYQKLTLLAIAAVLTCGAFLSAFAADNKNTADDGSIPAISNEPWYTEAVAYVQEQGLMTGTTPTDFAPEASLTRAMLVTVLYRLAGEPAVSGDDGFRDTADGQWYANGITWATRQKIVNGYGNGLFGPNDAVTQEQLSAVTSRYAGQDVTNGIPGFTGGAAPATRAQTATALLNLSKLPTTNDTNSGEDTAMVKEMNVQIGEYTFTAILEDVEAVQELVDMLQDGPLTVGMTDYSGFEKVGSLGRSLTASDEPTTTEAGDIVLYNGDNIVIFYGSNSWSYTRLGKIDDLTNWRTALGRGNVTAVFSLPTK